MSKRSTNYVNKPDSNWNELKNQLNNSTFYLLARHGPTVFSIKDDISNSKPFRVTIGNPHVCSCSLNKTKLRRGSLSLSVAVRDINTPTGIISSNNSSSNEIVNENTNIDTKTFPHHQSNVCIHILFCILKVLRISDTHILSYQTSYTENEIEQVLSDKFIQPNNFIYKNTNKSKEKKDEIINHNGFVDRQILTNDNEICPICQDSMISDSNIDNHTSNSLENDSNISNPIPLTWCRKGCGNNIHAKCMYSYAQYKLSSKLDITCPLCREDWLVEYLRTDCQVDRYINNKLHKVCTVKCFSCCSTIKNNFYRCIECSNTKQIDKDTTCNNNHNDKKLDSNFSNALTIGMDRDNEITSKPSNTPVRYNLTDYCHRCFTTSISKKHRNHHFIQSNVSININDVSLWSVISNPLDQLANNLSNQITNQLTNILHTRELNDNDYNMLLSLDNQNTLNIPLTTHILSSYTCIPSGHCWCNNKLDSHLDNNVDSLSNEYIQLLCNHTAHKQCLYNEMSKADDMMLLYDTITCKHSNCNRKIFLYLNRIKLINKPNKKLASNSNDDNNNKAAVALPPLTTTSVYIGMRSSSLSSHIKKKSNGLMTSGHLMPLNNYNNLSNQPCNLELRSISNMDKKLSKIDRYIDRKIKYKEKKNNYPHVLTPIDLNSLTVSSNQYNNITNVIDIINNDVITNNFTNQKRNMRPNTLVNNLSKSYHKMYRSQSLDNNILSVSKINTTSNKHNSHNRNNIDVIDEYDLD